MNWKLIGIGLGFIGYMAITHHSVAAEQKVDRKFDKVQCHSWTGGVGAQSHSFSECNVPPPDPAVATVFIEAPPQPAPQSSPPVVKPKPIRQ